jgi:hypothetical protein
MYDHMDLRAALEFADLTLLVSQKELMPEHPAPAAPKSMLLNLSHLRAFLRCQQSEAPSLLLADA